MVQFPIWRTCQGPSPGVWGRRIVAVTPCPSPSLATVIVAPVDHQWGDFTTRGIGWDWLSLNLDDGSDLTVSVVWERAGHKPISTYGTYIPADSAPLHLPGNDISLDSTGTWTSSVTGAVYPMNWKLRVDSLELDLTLTPSKEKAEFDLSAFIPMVYWEGSVVAMGTRNGAPVAGRGFVEMVGYAPSILSRRCTPLSTGPATKGNIMLIPS